jgi:epoxyqueuosine reductase QueG
VRFSKIFTNLPLAHDAPRRLGVREVCDMCTRCADACPVKALPFGAPDDTPTCASSIRGVRKWTSNAEKCFGYWAKLASDCAICLRVCPFNRDYGRRVNRWWLRLALSPLRKVALRLDDLQKRADRLKPRQWWQRLTAR